MTATATVNPSYIMRTHNVAALLNEGVSIFYEDLGDCNYVCSNCGANFWYEERVKSRFRANDIRYHSCCEQGRVAVPIDNEPPEGMKALLRSPQFMENIRAYNQMFSMTSLGARVDNSINNGRSPYVFKISGQIYHWIGSLCPVDGDMPRFLQMYIYDTEHEAENRMVHFGGIESSNLSLEIVQQLINMLDKHNELVKLFRTARDKLLETDIPPFKLRLFSVVGARQYGLPTSNTLGAIVFDSGPKTIGDYDVIIECKDGPPQRVNKLHRLYMPLQFPLAFFFGQPGYDASLTLRNPPGCRVRKGRLFQQYIVTAYCSIELARIDYIRKHQQDIRNDYLSGLYDAVSTCDCNGSDVGSRVILPSSFTGGPRYMYSHYLDALAICRVYGNPQFFITFTCNSRWPEIRRFMQHYPMLTAADRADIVARVFHMKVNRYLIYLKKDRPFGNVRAVLYTIEFQKRGLPHCHSLLWVSLPASTFTVDNIDTFISAELPDPTVDKCGYDVVSELMMHGPCGLAFPEAPCMEEFRCSKHFPKKYNDTTFFDKEGCVHYRRRNTNISIRRANVDLDNSYVVPYNISLCKKFHAHINVKYCGWSMLIKYLFKYISKGSDRVVAQITKANTISGESSNAQIPPVDEIQNFVDARYVCAHEASWRIFNFPIHYRQPSVQILAVHLENMQLISFRSRQPICSVLSDPSRKITTLTGWLAYNNDNTDGRHLTYLDFPGEFIWYVDSKKWKKRIVRNKVAVGRLSYIHPSSGEVFYLRMLLCHQKGCTDFINLRTVNNITHPTYRSACEALGLLDDNKEWDTVLEESSATATASQIRSLFSYILIYCDISDPLSLWKKYWIVMSDDIPLKAASHLHILKLHINRLELEFYVLYELEILLNRYSKSVTDFGLPSIPQHLLHDLDNRLIMEEKNYDRDILTAEKNILLQKINDKQNHIYDTVINAISRGNQCLVFVYGHGGTGKTFLWKTIITSLRSEGKIVLAVASSGIASLLLPTEWKR